MGSVSRRSTIASLLLALPVTVASIALTGTAAAGPRSPAQASSGAVAANAQFKFAPATITIATGGKVTWTNTGGGYHTVTGGDGTPDSSSPVGRGVIDTTGKTYAVTFTEPGTYKYYCEPHLALGMKGEVVVAAAGGSPASTPPTTEAPVVSPSAVASTTAATAPPAEPTEEEGVPGIAGNKTLESIDEERAAYDGAVSGFRFFTMVAVAFLLILSAAVLFSTRPRRAGR